MRSMLGVRPIIPWVYAPTFHIPMSSPKMTRMLGCFCGAAFCWASAGAERQPRRTSNRNRGRDRIGPPLEGHVVTRRGRTLRFADPPCRVNLTSAAASERVQEQSRPELRLEPGGLGGHDLPGVA